MKGTEFCFEQVSSSIGIKTKTRNYFYNRLPARTNRAANSFPEFCLKSFG